MIRAWASAIGIASLLFVACGGETESPGERPDMAQLGGKADLPEWLRHIPLDFHCDSKVSGRFVGWDSAHLYSFAGKVGYEYTFRFEANYQWFRGAAVAVYDAETGERVALARESADNRAELVYRAERSVKYLVAVYSVWWVATGDYSLSAECEVVERTCKANSDCDAHEFCAQSDCGQTGDGLGRCTERAQACYKIYRPVCGCDGRDYGNDCEARVHGMNIAHEGQCLAITLDKKSVSEGEAVLASLENTLFEPVFVAGCSPFGLMSEETSGWGDSAPTRVCFWEGYGQQIEGGGAYEESVSAELGTHRVTGGYSLGCKVDEPLSQAECRVHVPARTSESFEVTGDACWGAWIDAEGRCRTPADGVYPDSCCDDARMERCHQIDAKYVAAVEKGSSCSLLVTAPQCQTLVANNLSCGTCTQAINLDEAVLGLDKLRAEWQAVGCAQLPFMCPAYMCPMATGGTCEAWDDGGARCVTQR